MVALQSFGAYGGNFNPHAHAIVADGAFTPEGEFLPLPSLDTSAIVELFRRLLLQRLHEAERLSEAFMDKLLSWVHPGFSVFAGPPVQAEAVESLQSQARYIAGPAMAMDALQQRPDPPIPGVSANAIMVRTATGPEPPLHQQVATAPVARQTPSLRRTGPTFPRKPEAGGCAC